jgi:hypothetical protein
MALSLIGILVVLPNLNDTPALTATEERLGPPLTSDTTGKQVPIVGRGPLVRVLLVRRQGGQVTGLDPGTTRVEVTFTPAEQKHIGQSAYVIRRFGYSDTAQRTISLTFDDGPDSKWTPELLNLLAAEKVPATFFATGAASHVVRGCSRLCRRDRTWQLRDCHNPTAPSQRRRLAVAE